MKKEVNYYIDQSVADRELDKVIAELNSIRANVAESVDVRAEKEREFIAKQTTRLTAMFDLEEKLLKYRLDNSGSDQDIVKLKRQEALKKITPLCWLSLCILLVRFVLRLASGKLIISFAASMPLIYDQN